MSIPTPPNLVRQWMKDIDQTANMDELDHFGVAFGTSSMEFGTLDSKIVQGIVKINPREFRKKIDVLDERQYGERDTILTGRKIMFQTFSFIDINKTQGRAKGSSDLLNIELHAHAVQSRLG